MRGLPADGQGKKGRGHRSGATGLSQVACGDAPVAYPMSPGDRSYTKREERGRDGPGTRKPMGRHRCPVSGCRSQCPGPTPLAGSVVSVVSAPAVGRAAVKAWLSREEGDVGKLDG
jgi:hypothetical protein